MDEHAPKLNLDALSEWSKWAIGLSLFSASGCVGVLLGADVKEGNLPNIQTAIVCFLVTVVIAWGVQLFTALSKSDDSESANRTQRPVLRAILWFLVIAEVVAFMLSIFYLSRWVLKIKAKAKPATAFLKILSPENGFPIQGDSVFVVGAYNKSNNSNEVVQCRLVIPNRVVLFENKQPDTSGIFSASIPTSLLGQADSAVVYLTIYNKKDNQTIAFDFRKIGNKKQVLQNTMANPKTLPAKKPKPKMPAFQTPSGY